MFGIVLMPRIIVKKTTNAIFNLKYNGFPY